MAPSGRTRSTGRSQLLTDAVEKVDDMPPSRNNRIMGADFLNRSCAFDARLESMLLGGTPQNPFSTASTKSGCRCSFGHWGLPSTLDRRLLLHGLGSNTSSCRPITQSTL